MPFNNYSKHNYNENRKKYHNNWWIRTNPFPEYNEQWHLDEHKRTDKPVRYHISDFESQYTTIYKSDVLNEHDVQKSIKLSNGISIDVYALPMIVALSFRLNTMGAYRVRECVMNKLTTKPRNGILFLNVRTHECMNENKYGHN